MISKDIEITLECEGKSIKITGNGTTDYNLVTIDGIDTIPMVRQMAKSPVQDGSTVVISTADNRQIDMRIFTLESKREALMNLLNPKIMGLMTVTRNGISRQINYLVEGQPSPNEHIHPYMFVDIRLLSPDPWFRDVDSFGKNLAQLQPLHGFPLLWVVGKKYAVEKRAISTKTGLINNGHDVAPFTCQIKSREKVVNPSIKTVNKNGEVLMIRVNVTLERGEYIDIISHDYPPEHLNVLFLPPGQTAVAIVLNGTKNILDRTDIRNTTFFLLERGANEFEYSADEGVTNMEVRPRFRGRFTGV